MNAVELMCVPSPGEGRQRSQSLAPGRSWARRKRVIRRRRRRRWFVLVESRCSETAKELWTSSVKAL